MWFHFFHKWRDVKRIKIDSTEYYRVVTMEKCNICNKIEYHCYCFDNKNVVVNDFEINKQQYDEYISNVPIKTIDNHKEIELKAYLIAEQDGFSKSPEEYWLIAERLINDPNIR